MVNRKISDPEIPVQTVAAGNLLPAEKAGFNYTVNTDILLARANHTGTQAITTLAAFTSAQLLAQLSDETGTGLAVFSTSPTLVTPTIGVATATSINKVTITAPATSATLTIADGKTVTISKTLTLTGTDGTVMTFPTTSATIARTDAGNIFLGDQFISKASPAVVVNKAAAGQFAALNFQTAGLIRFLFGTDNVAEGGANAGSNLVLVGYNDAGGSLGTYITVNRATAAVTLAGSLLSVSPTGGIGYGTGAGGTVTQATNKATGVSLSTASGQITMNNAALAAATIVSFVLTNTAIAATDVLVMNHVSGGTPGSYTLNAQCAGGTATINVRNNTAGSLSEAIVLSFVLIKAVTS